MNLNQTQRKVNKEFGWKIPHADVEDSKVALIDTTSIELAEILTSKGVKLILEHEVFNEEL